MLGRYYKKPIWVFGLSLDRNTAMYDVGLILVCPPILLCLDSDSFGYGLGSDMAEVVLNPTLRPRLIYLLFPYWVGLFSCTYSEKCNNECHLAICSAMFSNDHCSRNLFPGWRFFNCVEHRELTHHLTWQVEEWLGQTGGALFSCALM